jgi:hypothetical protein
MSGKDRIVPSNTIKKQKPAAQAKKKKKVPANQLVVPKIEQKPKKDPVITYGKGQNQSSIINHFKQSNINNKS